MQQKWISKVRDLSHQGLGVADTPDGRVVFVPGTWPGDEVELEIDELKPGERYGFARMLRLISPSLDRAEVPCSHWGWQSGKCGGCSWMLARYPAQLIEKQKSLQQQMRRAGLDFPVLPILASKQELGYRNRAQLKTNGESLGYVSRNSHDLAPIKDCLILDEQNRNLLQDLRATLPRSDWQPQPGYHWNFIELDGQSNTHEIKINQRNKFRQGNTQQNQVMREWLRDRSDLLGESVLELFAGSGNFTEVLVQASIKQIVAAEADGAALDELRERAWSAVKVVAADLYRRGSWNDLKKSIRPHSLIIDPPREGFKDLALFMAQFSSLRSCIYISCDSSTWSRDVSQLLKKNPNWQLIEVQPLDLFPQTPHVEVLSVLQQNLKER